MSKFTALLSNKKFILFFGIGVLLLTGIFVTYSTFFTSQKTPDTVDNSFSLNTNSVLAPLPTFSAHTEQIKKVDDKRKDIIQNSRASKLKFKVLLSKEEVDFVNRANLPSTYSYQMYDTRELKDVLRADSVAAISPEMLRIKGTDEKTFFEFYAKVLSNLSLNGVLGRFEIAPVPNSEEHLVLFDDEYERPISIDDTTHIAKRYYLKVNGMPVITKIGFLDIRILKIKDTNKADIDVINFFPKSSKLELSYNLVPGEYTFSPLTSLDFNFGSFYSQNIATTRLSITDFVLDENSLLVDYYLDVELGYIIPLVTIRSYLTGSEYKDLGNKTYLLVANDK